MYILGVRLGRLGIKTKGHEGSLTFDSPSRVQDSIVRDGRNVKMLQP